MTSPRPALRARTPPPRAVRSPSNSRRIVSYGRPITCASTLSRPRCAIPITTSCAPASAASSDRLVEHRDEHVEAFDRELLLAEERLAQVRLEPLHLGEPREQRTLLVLAERRAVTAGLDRLAQPDALLVVGDVLDLVGDRPAVGLAAVAAAPRRASRPRRSARSSRAGSAPAARASAAASGVSASSAGSPGGSEPSGSSRAARWPCVRYALTSAIAAATPPSSSSSGSAAAAAAALWQFAWHRRRARRFRGRASSRRTRPGCSREQLGAVPVFEDRRAIPRERTSDSRGTARAAEPAKPAFSAST